MNNMYKPLSTTSTILFGLVLLLACSQPKENLNEHQTAPPQEYVEVVEKLDRAIRLESKQKSLPGFAVVLVDDQEIVWAQAYGHRDLNGNIDNDLETVYKIGSVSKLFTDIAVMQLVERGEIDLDAPVSTYIPDFLPNNATGKEITLRQLMSHRSGLIREPRVGHYFDMEEPSLSATITSLNGTDLIYEPEAKVKYSNAGIAVVGYVLEKTQNRPFTDYLKEEIIVPMGLVSSAFTAEEKWLGKLAEGEMWSYDERSFVAPNFELGMAPAGSMYATITDLGTFMKFLFKDGEGENGRILASETLKQMWEPQFQQVGGRNFGIGFSLNERGGRKVVGHGGAIYGFATQLVAIPEEKLGVAVVATADGANTITNRIANYALDLMLAQEDNNELPNYQELTSVPEERWLELAGTYADEKGSVLIEARSGVLMMERDGVSSPIRTDGNEFIADGRLRSGPIFSFDNGNIIIGERTLQPVEVTKPEPSPANYSSLIGEYGWDHNVLFIYEKDGKLRTLIEWFFDYELTELSETDFAFPTQGGLYHGEILRFVKDDLGHISHVEIPGSVVFPKRAALAAGETFRIDPIEPVEVLREKALAASPPEEGEKLSPDLVELVTLDPTIKLDIRYASTNNFMSAEFYTQPKAFMQRPAAEALVRANTWLKEQGYGLLIHDAYRPWYVTKMFYDATPEDKKIFVANPANGSRHNRGCAVDLTLYDLETGAVIEMVGGYDEFTERSYPFYVGGTSLQRWHRALLKKAMNMQGFTVYRYEWWHFDFSSWRDYPIINTRFEDISK